MKNTTSALKLRVSSMAQSTMIALGDRADASELRFIKWQPTADDVILRSIGVLPQPL